MSRLFPHDNPVLVIEVTELHRYNCVDLTFRSGLFPEEVFEWKTTLGTGDLYSKSILDYVFEGAKESLLKWAREREATVKE